MIYMMSFFSYDELVSEFYDLISHLQIPPEVNRAPLRITLLLFGLFFGLMTLVLCACTAILAKRGYAISVAAGFSNLIACLCMPWRVLQFHEPLEIEYLYVSSSVGDMLGQFLRIAWKNIVPWSLYVLSYAMVLIAFVVSVIYFVRMVKVRPRAFSIIALIIFILKTLLVPEIPFFSAIARILLVGHSSGFAVAHQIFQAHLALSVTLFAFFLPLIAAFITLIKRSKANKRARREEEAQRKAEAERAAREEFAAREAAAAAFTADIQDVNVDDAVADAVANVIASIEAGDTSEA